MGCKRKDSGGCYSWNEVNLQTAKDKCNGLGTNWRLCSRQEVNDDVCQSAGCNIDNYLVWALETVQEETINCVVRQATADDCNVNCNAIVSEVEVRPTAGGSM